jgi:hypothetical protein
MSNKSIYNQSFIIKKRSVKTFALPYLLLNLFKKLVSKLEMTSLHICVSKSPILTHKVQAIVSI